MLNLGPFYNLIFVCDLDIRPTKTNVFICITISQGEHLYNFT